MNNLLKLARVEPGFLKSIFKHFASLDWEIQGFGMLRTYLSRDVRLHIWSHDLRKKDVSSIHNHPWDFTSLVLRGAIFNERFVEMPGEVNYNRATIRCGVDAKIESDVEKVRLEKVGHEVVASGEFYSQTASELHDTAYQDGTITLIERHAKPDPDHARVYWPLGAQWVDARPRKASLLEASEILSRIII